jgi:hypothetical protein
MCDWKNKQKNQNKTKLNTNYELDKKTKISTNQLKVLQNLMYVYIYCVPTLTTWMIFKIYVHCGKENT